MSYNLVSDIFFDPIDFQVTSSQVKLLADESPRLTYYLDLNDSTSSYSAAVLPGVPIDVPGIVEMTWIGGMGLGGVLLAPLSSTFIPGTVKVFDVDGSEIPLVPDLSVTDPNIDKLVHTHASLVGFDITIVPTPVDMSGTYTVKFLQGPSTVTASLRVHLATQDSTVTPIFTGAYLEAV